MGTNSRKSDTRNRDTENVRNRAGRVCVKLKTVTEVQHSHVALFLLHV